jgi:hypothetical protein
MIIDGDSFANIASDTLMKKLNLSCIKHPRPYRLQWFNKCGEVKITKQVYDDQMKLKKECEDEKSENSREDNCERRSSDLAKSKSLVKPLIMFVSSSFNTYVNLPKKINH